MQARKHEISMLNETIPELALSGEALTAYYDFKWFAAQEEYWFSREFGEKERPAAPYNRQR